MTKSWLGIFAAVAAAALTGCATTNNEPQRSGLDRIEHIVVIYAENHSFDNMYGMFPGANGVANATAEQKTQLDLDGKALAHLPPVYTPAGKPDPRYPPNAAHPDPLPSAMRQVSPNPASTCTQSKPVGVDRNMWAMPEPGNPSIRSILPVFNVASSK